MKRGEKEPLVIGPDWGADGRPYLKLRVVCGDVAIKIPTGVTVLVSPEDLPALRAWLETCKEEVGDEES